MPRFSANLSLLFKEHPPLERLAAARRAGFRAVEVQFPYDLPLEAWIAAKREAGVEFLLVNTPPGDFASGERGLAALPGREQDFRAAIGRTRAYVEALGITRVHVMSGIPPAGTERARA
ncbi:MAG: TIM barrel protein, partial [Alphaproteobacteria bacterium]|nr:TIM barrel protein [Alphaproteobacteria bacterium]